MHPPIPRCKSGNRPSAGMSQYLPQSYLYPTWARCIRGKPPKTSVITQRSCMSLRLLSFFSKSYAASPELPRIPLNAFIASVFVFTTLSTKPSWLAAGDNKPDVQNPAFSPYPNSKTAVSQNKNKTNHNKKTLLAPIQPSSQCSEPYHTYILCILSQCSNPHVVFLPPQIPKKPPMKPNPTRPIK